MKILVVGGGGREHAIIKKLKLNPAVETVYALPGNGGFAEDAVCVPIGAKDLPAIRRFAVETGIDYAVVSPDDPLVLGCVDELEQAGIPCFGPRKNAAILEGSKVFAKNLMKKYGIPTAAFEVFDDPAAALRYLETAPIPTVVKADGLALGKGVTVAMTREEACAAVRRLMQERQFGASGSRIVIEEYLQGPEVSVLSFTDGETVVPMVSSMDHKRAGDGDTGPNTGGMGTVAPNPFYTPEVAGECMEKIFLPTIRAMKAEGREFRGCLYFGLMLTPRGPKVIEYNCRFGDPETQVVLPLLKSDLLTVMQAVTAGALKHCPVEFSSDAACCVVLASAGYPESYQKGFEITIPQEVRDHVFVAGAALQKDGEKEKLVTAGGRVLGVTATAPTLPEAVKEAYRLAESVNFENRFMRSDIGRRALDFLASQSPAAPSDASAPVYRVFVEKKPGLDQEARALLSDARTLLGIKGLQRVRLLNRYDAQNLSRDLFDRAVKAVFSEPQLDFVSESVDASGAVAFAVEYLPGQFDQRADSAAQCIQLLSRGDRPLVRSARLYLLYGNLTDAEVAEIKKYVINPVEAREAALPKPATLRAEYPVPTEVPTLSGFTAMDRPALEALAAELGLAMDADDLACCRDYFRAEKRDPTLTEIRMLDTYWSDHCRHTTFLTNIDSVRFEDPLLQKAYGEYLAVRRELGRAEKPVTLMDLATVAVRFLKAKGKLPNLDESEEINACTVKIEVEADGVKEPWLLLFKNETHNHPTEIEPFGGAATCIGGAIRDPLSGRAYVYGAMRVTGAADPTVPVAETLPGKLPQRKLVTAAAAGYSSYGNQIGLATGIVDELYHPGYAAKRMEIGAVVAAAPQENVRRERPAPGDVVILLGGSTGRDGIGGATGSSKAHTAHSVETCGAEVQKGNAPEERKLQRLFRNGEATRMIKRCNDFGAGGVSVAIGELADGLEIDLNAVPKKYDGLDGTELAISESQERMAVVVAPEDAEAFLKLAKQENLQACPVAVVQAEPRLRMHWNGKTIVDISREFLNSNGAPKHIDVAPAKPESFAKKPAGGFRETLEAMAEDLNMCSHRGLSERFDSTIGAGTVLMPFGGKHQLTPIQAMVQKVSMEKKHTDDCSLMAWGYNPFITEKSPYHGAYLAVVESVSKLIAAGADFEEVYLTFQEYFEKPGRDARRWGKPLAALLGAFEAQKDLEIAAIGGKDSMSGSFENLDVPPTLVSFAVTMAKAGQILSPETKQAGHFLILLSTPYTAEGLPDAAALKETFRKVASLRKSGRAFGAYTPGLGGIAEAVMKMSFGNGLGFRFADGWSVDDLVRYRYGDFLVEVAEPEAGETVLGEVTADGQITLGGESVSLAGLQQRWENRLEKVYPCNIPTPAETVETFSSPASSWPAPAVKAAKPRVLIPAFPGTNCEYDSAKAVRDAGAEARIMVINNLTAEGIARSVESFAREIRESQIIFIPGGFSGGDEPDGSAKFITAFFRNDAVREGVTELLEKRDGLMCGICNGFQALIKLGLVPFGKIMETDEHCPTLTFNTIARHQSRIVRTRVASNLSPWLRETRVGDIFSVPISHGEGRFIAEEQVIRQLVSAGQIATQYVDLEGRATMDVRFNPNGSMQAIEGITSPDGRVFGKMGHSERVGHGLYKNVPGAYEIRMFESAVKYFK